MRWTIFQLSKLEDLTLILKGINSTGLCCFQGEGDEINIDSSFFFCLQPVHSFVDPHFSWVSAGWFMQKQDTCFSKIWTALTFILCHILRIVISFVLKQPVLQVAISFFSLKWCKNGDKNTEWIYLGSRTKIAFKLRPFELLIYFRSVNSVLTDQSVFRDLGLG